MGSSSIPPVWLLPALWIMCVSLLLGCMWGIVDYFSFEYDINGSFEDCSHLLSLPSIHGFP